MCTLNKECICMFEKDGKNEKYTRSDFTFEEKLFEKYLQMRGVVGELESKKYLNTDKYMCSEEFKQGFLAGVKVMSSILIDL